MTYILIVILGLVWYILYETYYESTRMDKERMTGKD
jgi:hypothetical protein